MINLNPDDRFATLINTFFVDPDRAGELVELLHEAADTMSQLTGFVSANLHLSEDRTRVVNYVQWQTKADFEAMLDNDRAQPHMQAAADLADRYEPILYSLRYSDTNPQG